MEGIVDFLNQGWVGALLALAALIFAFCQWMRRTTARLCFQYMGQKLIEGDGGLLPKQVSVTFDAQPVTRLSATHVVVWNAGPASLRERDIVPQDPIRFQFGGNILQAELSRATREVNSSNIVVNPDNDTELFYRFSFLDKDDGALIRVLHTGKSTKPKGYGTIIGERKGVRYLGRLSSQLHVARGLERASNPYEATVLRMMRYFNPLLWIILLFSASLVIAAIVPIFIAALDTGISETMRIPVALTAGLYALMCSFLLWVDRRRFPPNLAPDQEEKHATKAKKRGSAS